MKLCWQVPSSYTFLSNFSAHILALGTMLGMVECADNLYSYTICIEILQIAVGQSDNTHTHTYIYIHIYTYLGHNTILKSKRMKIYLNSFTLLQVLG